MGLGWYLLCQSLLRDQRDTMGIEMNASVGFISLQRSRDSVTEVLSRSLRKLSTGLRISRGDDDASGLASSERLRARIRSLEQARRNANDGISLVKSAVGALATVNLILIRLRELSMRSANGSSSGHNRDEMNEEFASLIKEVDRVGHSTKVGGVAVLDGSVSSVTLHVGPGTTPGIDTLSVSLESMLSTTLSLDGLDIGSTGNTSLAITNIDAAIETVASLRGRLAAIQNRLRSRIRSLEAQRDSASSAENRIRDVDVAVETAALTRQSVLHRAATTVLVHANANAYAILALFEQDRVGTQPSRPVPALAACPLERELSARRGDGCCHGSG